MFEVQKKFYSKEIRSFKNKTGTRSQSFFALRNFKSKMFLLVLFILFVTVKNQSTRAKRALASVTQSQHVNDHRGVVRNVSLLTSVKSTDTLQLLLRDCGQLKSFDQFYRRLKHFIPGLVGSLRRLTNLEGSLLHVGKIFVLGVRIRGNIY